MLSHFGFYAVSHKKLHLIPQIYKHPVMSAESSSQLRRSSFERVNRLAW